MAFSSISMIWCLCYRLQPNFILFFILAHSTLSTFFINSLRCWCHRGFQQFTVWLIKCCSIPVKFNLVRALLAMRQCAVYQLYGLSTLIDNIPTKCGLFICVPHNRCGLTKTNIFILRPMNKYWGENRWEWDFMQSDDHPHSSRGIRFKCKNFDSIQLGSIHAGLVWSSCRPPYFHRRYKNSLY